MRLSDYFNWEPRVQKKIPSAVAVEGVYLVRKYYASAAPLEITGSNFGHVYKVGMSKNLSKRLDAYINMGYCPFEITFIKTNASTTLHVERWLQGFFEGNEDTERYRGNEWFLVHAYYNARRDVTKGANSADALFEAMGSAKTADDFSLLEWCAAFNHLPAYMQLSTANVAADVIQSKVISINQLANKYKNCKLYQFTKGHALYQIIDHLQTAGVIQQIIDKPGWFCEKFYAKKYQPGLADYEQIPQITPLVGALL